MRPGELADDGEFLESMLLVVCIYFVFCRDHRIRMMASTRVFQVTLSLRLFFPRGQNALYFIHPFSSHAIPHFLFYRPSLICTPCYVSLSLALYLFYMCIYYGFSVIIHVLVW